MKSEKPAPGIGFIILYAVLVLGLLVYGVLTIYNQYK